MKLYKPQEDVEALRQAMTGKGTDETAIINILVHRTSNQRQIISKTYKGAFDRDLIEDLKSELGNHFEDVMVGLMTPMPLYLAQALHTAIHGRHINILILIEILCTRDHSSMDNINKAYKDEYGKELTADLHTLPTIAICEFFIAMATKDRSDLIDDLQIAKYLSQNTNILLEDQNNNETKFPKELNGFIDTIYESMQSPSVFFAKALNRAVAGIGTDDSTLIRLVVSRCDIDIGKIKEAYEKLYNESLEKAIRGDTSGDYMKALLTLIESSTEE